MEYIKDGGDKKHTKFIVSNFGTETKFLIEAITLE